MQGFFRRIAIRLAGLAGEARSSRGKLVSGELCRLPEVENICEGEPALGNLQRSRVRRRGWSQACGNGGRVGYG